MDNEFRLTPIKRVIGRDFQIKPESVFADHFLFKCKVKILVVTDSTSGGFGDSASFHLGKVLEVINDDPWNHVEFLFTKAHRTATAMADVIQDFTFDDHDLSQYSQIWLFGINRLGQGPDMRESELRALSRFMDSGGGVFATTNWTAMLVDSYE